MVNKWKYVPFSEAVDIYDSQRKPINSKERSTRIVGKQTSELYPYYGATGRVGYIDEYITNGEYVLLGEDGAPFLDSFAKKAYLINGKSWVNNHAHVLHSKTNNKFLCYYLNSFNYKGYVSGTTRLKLTQSDMKRIQVPMPPNQEQERIVARIEELFSELDKGVEILNTVKQQLNIYRHAVLREAFESVIIKKTEIHEIVDNIRIGPFGTMLHKDDYISGGIPIINPQHIKNNLILPADNVTVALEKAIELNTYRLQENDIIMGRRGEMGRAAPVSKKENGWLCGTGSILFRLKTDFDAVFYSTVLSSPAVVRYLEDNAIGTTMKNLNEEIVKHIPVPYVTRSIQKSITEDIDMKLSVCNNIEQTVEKSLQQSVVIRQSILQQAFEGRLV